MIKEIQKLNSNTLEIYLKEIGKYNILTPEEEYNLAILAQKGDLEAKNQLLLHNLKSVVSIASKNISSCVSLEDKIQEGNLGLITAIEKFDPTKGYKFSTYATWWIKQKITRSIGEQGNIIRKPVNYQEKKRKVNKYIEKIEKNKNITPSYEEIAKATGLNVSNVKLVLSLEKESISLNSTVGEEKDSKLEDFIADDCNYVLDLENEYLKKIINNEIKNTFLKINDLDEEEIEVLTEFGKKMNKIKNDYNKNKSDIKNMNSQSLFYKKALNELSKLKRNIRFKMSCSNYKYKSDEEFEQEIKEIDLVIKYFSDYITGNRTIYSDDLLSLLKSLKENNINEYNIYIKELNDVSYEYLEKINLFEKNTNIKEINNKINNFKKQKAVKQYLRNLEDAYLTVIKNLLKERKFTDDITNIALNIIKKNCCLYNLENVNDILNGINEKDIEKCWMEQLVLILQSKNILYLEQLEKLIQYYNISLKQKGLLLNKLDTSYFENYEEYNELLTGLREKDILEKRYGINGEVCTLEDIANEYGLTKERVRQIEKKVLKNFKNNLYTNPIFNDYVLINENENKNKLVLKNY